MSPSSEHPRLRRILIVSHHPIFAEGLRHLFNRVAREVEVVAVVDSLEAAWQVEEEAQPDVMVLDYDDQEIALERCLLHLAQGHRPLRVVLLSLQREADVVVFDRWVLPSESVETRVARLLDRPVSGHSSET